MESFDGTASASSGDDDAADDGTDDGTDDGSDDAVRRRSAGTRLICTNAPPLTVQLS